MLSIPGPITAVRARKPDTVKPTWKYRLPRRVTERGAVVAPTTLKRESEGQSNAMPLGLEG